MKTKEKILKKAKKIDGIKIDPSRLTEVGFNDFSKLAGKVYILRDELYTSYKGEWYKTKIPGENSVAEQKDNSDAEKVDLETNNYVQIVEWCKNIKNYVDFKFDKLRKELDDVEQSVQEILKMQKQILSELKTLMEKK